MRRLAFLALCSLVTPMLATSQATRADTTTDPYLWLEEMHGTRAMAWVNAENARTNAVLEKDPRYAGLFKAALTIAQAKDRSMGLPYYFFEVIEGGHGSGANIAQQVHTTALEFTYFARQLMDQDRKIVQ